MNRISAATLGGGLLLLLSGCGIVMVAPSPGMGGATQSSYTCTGAGAYPQGWNSPGQIANEQAVAKAALGLGLGPAGVLVGELTILVEADANNLNVGDMTGPGGTMSTSRGLFQQIAAWGPLTSRTDPAQAATMFFKGGQAGQKGLMSVPGWQSMDPGVAMQAVQGSEFAGGQSPGYAAKLVAAKAITAATTGACSKTAAALPVANAAAPGSGLGGAIIAAAQSQLGVRYSWGGGDLRGPTVGQHDGGVADRYGDYAAVGWDCSALTRFAVYTATAGRVEIPRTAADQRSAGQSVPANLDSMQPGDIVVIGTGHVGIYVGNGQMINAPQSGSVVKYDSLTGSGVNGNKATWTVRRIPAAV